MTDSKTAPKNGQKWTWQDFCRIIFQTAQGLKYLHTSVQNFRNAIRHGDLKPGNILLDKHGNACICDTGMAVEMPRDRTNVTATNAASGTHHFIDPDVLKSRSKRIENDVYAFGIVLLQVLVCSTGEDYSIFLQTVLTSGGLTKENISGCIADSSWNVWNEAPDEMIDILIELALKCIQGVDKRISISNVCAEFEDIFKKFSNKGLEKHRENSNYSECCMCHFFEPAGNLDCCGCEKARFCSGCVSSSSVNPLVCPKCGPCEPPIGGRDVYALLIAGKGVGVSREIEEHVFVSDVRKMENCFNDARVMGIRNENIFSLFPNEKRCKDKVKDICSTANVLSKLDEIADRMRSSQSKRKPVLILYMSCHGNQENGQLSWILRDTLSCNTLKEKLVTLPAEMILTIFDCCYASAADVLPFGDCKGVHQSLIQWSSCHASQKSKFNPTRGDTYGSYFTTCVLKGLTMTANSKCPNNGKPAENCELCRKYRGTIAYHQCVYLGELQEFVRKHLEKKCHPNNSMTPRVSFHGSSLMVKLAYYNAEPLGFKILFRKPDGQKQLVILEKTLAELKDLPCVKTFVCQKLKDVSLEESSTEACVLSDKLCITHVNVRGQVEELMSVEDVERIYDRFEIPECYLKDK